MTFIRLKIANIQTYISSHKKGYTMKKAGVAVVIMLSIALYLAGNSIASAGGPKDSCTRIKDGELIDSIGNPLVLGFDQFGYNYQAHQFNGTYDSSDRKLDGKYFGKTGDYVDDRLSMKWSEDWLSNMDCNDDGKLDRGAPGSSGWPLISQGWLTNHLEGDYDSDGDGTQDAHYTGFDKIVWVGPGGSLWGQYEIIQEVWNDPAAGLHGLQLKIPAPGFGLNEHWTE